MRHHNDIWYGKILSIISSLSLPLFFPQYIFFCTLLADGNWRFSHDNYYRAFNDQQLQNERSSYEITNVNNFISMLLAFDVSFFLHSFSVEQLTVNDSQAIQIIFFYY